MGKLRTKIGAVVYRYFPALKTKLFWIKRGKDYYSENISRSYKMMYDELAGRVIAVKPVSVLEYGCGYGYLLKNIADKNSESMIKSFHGFDFSKTQVANARKYFPEGKFINADITERINGYSDNEFDVAIGVGVLMYLKQPEIKVALKELKRITRKEVYIVEYYYKYLSEDDKLRYRNAQPVDGREIYDYEELLKDNGFNIIQVIGFDKYFDKSVTDEMPHTLIVASPKEYHD